MAPTSNSVELKKEIQRVSTTLKGFLQPKGYYGDQFEFVANPDAIEFIKNIDSTILTCALLSILAEVKTNVGYLERIIKRTSG